jgi:hypothetical protein
MAVCGERIEALEDSLQSGVRSGVAQGKLRGLTGLRHGCAASRAELRQLFAASAEFHDALPWEAGRKR